MHRRSDCMMDYHFVAAAKLRPLCRERFSGVSGVWRGPYEATRGKSRGPHYSIFHVWAGNDPAVPREPRQVARLLSVFHIVVSFGVSRLSRNIYKRATPVTMSLTAKPPGAFACLQTLLSPLCTAYCHTIRHTKIGEAKVR